ncbi:MAG: transporter [Xanthomonadaceae bacterium]|nr:transporter [Xanthomonadaceae bacterium]
MTTVTSMQSMFPTRLLAMSLVILAGGCSVLGGNKTPATIYAPAPSVTVDPAWPTVDWQLAIARPEAERIVDSLRISVRPTPGELEVYKGASWGSPPSEQLQSAVLHALEDSHKIKAVARQGTGLSADYTLLTDLRRFEADYAGAAVPSATIEINAKLLDAVDQDLVASQTFRQSVPAGTTDTAAVSQAFETALGSIAHDIVGWTLVTGNQHVHRVMPPPRPRARSGGKSG